MNQTLLDQVKSRKFWQAIDLPDGSHTDGVVDHRGDPPALGINKELLVGKRVLDIAANDGYWAFFSEQSGASEVVAIDVEQYQAYDWGHQGMPDRYRDQPAKNENFEFLHRLFDSKVVRHPLSVYDLDPQQHGIFDVTFCYGLLYHLRHPLLAIDRIRAVTSDVVVIQSHHVNMEPSHLPACIFYGDDVLDNADTNWSGPTNSCIAHWLRDAGFPHVYLNELGYAIGCVSEDTARHFRAIPKLSYCDDQYYAAARNAILKIHRRTRKLTFPRRIMNKAMSLIVARV